MVKNSRKIAISGWPGAGSTTLSLILAYELKIPLLLGSNTFRYLVKELSNQNLSDGSEFSDIDNLIGKYFDVIYDKYVDHKLLSNDSFILVSDIAAFRLGKRSEFYSIFLLVDFEERQDRMVVDGRKNDKSNLSNRDKSLRERYKSLYGIDAFDVKEIKEKYNLLVNTTDVPIKDELKLVYKGLLDANFIDKETFNALTKSADETDKEFWDRGKEWFMSNLKDAKLLIDGDDILREIYSLYKDEVEALPSNLKNIIVGLSEAR